MSTRTRFGDAQMLGEQILHHVRSLRALINGHPLLTFVPVGDDRARLVGHAGVTAEAERGLDHGAGSANALSTAPTSSLRSKQRLSPSEE